MTTKEVAQTCGVDERTIQVNAKKVGIELGSRWNPHDFTEDEVKRVQAQLMINSTNQGNSSVVVKESAKAAFGEGLSLQVIMDSGNLEALEEFVELARKGTQAKHDLLLAQKQNQLLLEQKEKAEAETERIYQVNKNFHANLYTASQIAKKLGITANMVGRIANENGLKQDPIYGKLGKIQLNNGQWVNQFYYNDDALTVMEAVIG